MEMGEKLKMLRAEKGISQQALADAIHVSRSAIAKWENGLGYPSQDSYEALIAFYGVDENYFRTEKPEAVIVTKNRHIRLLRILLIAVFIAVAVLALTMGQHWISSVDEMNIDLLAKQAAAYLGYDRLEIAQMEQRWDYLAALCVDKSGNFSMCVFERDDLFENRWRACGGKKSITSGRIESWNYGSSRKEAVLIFCGGGLSEEICWYIFENGGIEYTCPVENGKVLDVFIILDSSNINGVPTALDQEKQPVR